MKSKAFRVISILLFVSILIACNKDTNPPVITVIGNNPISCCIGIDYLDQGATAFDDEDGDITDKINTTYNVDKDQIGTYTVVYTVEDEAGNSATATRTVNVIYCK